VSFSVSRISNYNLAGDVLTIEYPSFSPSGTVINLDNAAISIGAQLNVIGGDPTLNVSGNSSVNFLTPEPEYFSPIINLAANAHLLMKGDLHFASINFNGGPGSEIINNGTISYFVGGGRISTSLMGTGTVDVSRSHDGSGMLEVNGAVGSGQTFDLLSNEFSATLKIDQPYSFGGAVDIEPESQFGSDVIYLAGLHANTYDLKNDMLRLYNGNSIVDTLRLNNGTSEPVTVAQNSSNVIVEFGAAAAPGILLAHH
jgi:hypothetical protein